VIATNAHVVAHLLKVAMYETLKFRVRTKLRNSGSPTDPIELSPMNLIAIMVLFCHQRSVCNYLTHKRFGSKGGSSMDVGQVEMFWYAVHIGDRCFLVAENNNTLMLNMVYCFVCPFLSLCVTARATSDGWDCVQTFIVQYIRYCRIPSEMGYLLNTSVSKLGFPSSMQREYPIFFEN